MQKRQNYYHLAAAVLLLIMFLMAFFSSAGFFGDPGDACTVDEAIHIVAGYSYLRYQDYRLNVEHPPLVKVLAALPLLIYPEFHFFGENTDWNIDKHNSLVNEINKDLSLYESGSNGGHGEYYTDGENEYDIKSDSLCQKLIDGNMNDKWVFDIQSGGYYSITLIPV